MFSFSIRNSEADGWIFILIVHGKAPFVLFMATGIIDNLTATRNNSRKDMKRAARGQNKMKKQYEFVMKNMTKEQLCSKLQSNVFTDSFRTVVLEDRRGFCGNVEENRFEIYYIRNMDIDKEFFMGIDGYPTVMKGEIEEIPGGIKVIYSFTNRRRIKGMVYTGSIISAIMILMSIYTMGFFNPIFVLLTAALCVSMFFMSPKKIEVERFEELLRSIAPEGKKVV